MSRTGSLALLPWDFAVENVEANRGSDENCRQRDEPTGREALVEPVSPQGEGKQYDDERQTEVRVTQQIARWRSDAKHPQPSVTTRLPALRVYIDKLKQLRILRGPGKTMPG